MNKNKHWQSFGERNLSEEYKQDLSDEFKKNEPTLEQSPTKRRDFLKYLGFSTAAALAAASCETPIRKAIPYAIKPEEINPGQASFYATTYSDGGEAISIVAKVRDGRPIKIEGNELCKIYQGKTTAQVQASVLDLYDQYRIKNPLKDKQNIEFNEIVSDIQNKTSLGQTALLTPSINSPSTLEIINQIKVKNPNFKHIVYDADSYSALILANEYSYGVRKIPSYHFENAKIIIGIECDFLGTWLNPLEFSRQYAINRKINEKKPELSYHFQVESIPTITGSMADNKINYPHSKMKYFLTGLLDALLNNTLKIQDKKIVDIIKTITKKLKENPQQSLVVCGINDQDCQKITNEINSIILANGSTIDWSKTINTKTGLDSEMEQFVNDLALNKYNQVIFYDVNPAYTWYNAQTFISALEKVPTKISLNAKMDETTTLCNYVLPSHHYLESWGDFEPKSNYFIFQQPTINPLFKTQDWQDNLIAIYKLNLNYPEFLKNYWVRKLGNEEKWFKILQNGVFEANDTTTFQSKALLRNNSIEDFIWYNNENSNNFELNELELVAYKKIGIGLGRGAENPWLQELPDPISRATWDNYFIVSPKFAAKNLKIDLENNVEADAYEVNPAKKVMTVKMNKLSLSLPVLIIPGTDEKTIGVALGYGRNNTLGSTCLGVGKNASPFLRYENQTIRFNQTPVNFQVENYTYPVALSQTHHRYDTQQGVRTEVIKEISLKEFKENPHKIVEEREEELKPYGGLQNFEKEGTLYPYYDKPGIKWGMNVDMNLCNGCGACVVACTAENNVPVVGKEEVLRFHEMHWIRIDKYYSGDLSNPKVTFQPIMCQHCDNAPCENVCPVSATNHSSEGLNQMAYNRCIGTRYCANNCPYKVRRFNWSDYMGADSFPNNQVTKVGKPVLDINSDLTRMVLNPDVTVRSRGVIEKCSFCVQRLQEAKLNAKKENRTLIDSDIKVACQQTCPTNAIQFGNANDIASQISTVREENKLRQYAVLEQLHVLPNVTYLAKIRNEEYL